MILYALWILLSTWLISSGWALSLFKQLNAAGYTVSLLIFGILTVGILRQGAQIVISKSFQPLIKLLRRFRRPIPIVYLIYFLAALIGGLLHAPSNYDALCYRLPRVLHWGAAGGWHWIGGINIRMDYSATGFEWLAAPLLMLFKTDRLLFLINVISYALLPGLIYSVLAGLGIRRRVAWYWMWLLPTAYCFVLQAGSIGNDMFATVYFMASAAFALRAVKMSSWSYAALSILAAALMTGAKASNLPLLLPLAFLVTGMVKILLRKPWKSLLLLIIACSASFLPIALMNIRYTGDWTGDPNNSEKMKISNPIAGLTGNFLELSFGALVPPVFPVVKSYNTVATQWFMKEPLRSIRDQYPRVSLSAGELATEEGAGLGAGLFILCCVGMFFSVNRNFQGGFSHPAMIFGLLSCVALAVFMAKMGSESAARLASPYYVGLIIPLLSFRSQGLLISKRWWRLLALACALSVFPALPLNPARPLIPIPLLIDAAESLHVSESVVTRIKNVYQVYGNRSDSLVELRGHLPSGSKRIGFAGTGNESEYSLWKPFGERRVLDLVTKVSFDSPSGEINCIVGSEEGIFTRSNLSAEEYARSIKGEVVWKEWITILGGREPCPWVVIVPGVEGHFSIPNHP